MKIRLISIGKREDEFVRIGADRFCRRIRRYHPLDEVRLKEVKAAKEVDVPRVIRQEGEGILKVLDPRDRVCVMDRTGEEMTSEDFADFLESELRRPGRSLSFVIGGAEGLARSVRLRADRRLSLSQMTFTHELARLLLLEQIYRGFTILRGKRYHR